MVSWQSGTSMTGGTLEVRIPRPHPGMQAVLRQMRRTTLLRAGRRWRKTTMLAMVNIERALRGAKRFHGAPTYEQARICWDEMKRMARGVFRFHESRLEAEGPNGGRIRCRSLDNPDNARGFTADGWTIDEFDFIDPRAYREVIQPQLMDTGGDLTLASTPNGMGLMWEEEERLRSVPDAAIFHAPTLGVRIVNGRLVRDPHPLENPFLPLEELERLFAAMSEMSFRQEILAEYTAREGLVFPDFCEDNIRPCPYDPSLPVYAGVDFGYRTPSVIYVQRQVSGLLRIFSDAEYRNTGTVALAERIAAQPWAKNIELVACDPAGSAHDVQTGIPDVELLRQHLPGVKVVWSADPKHRNPEWRAGRIRDLVRSVTGQVGLVADPACKTTLRMFRGSVYPPPRVGSGEKAEPVKDGIVDHNRDALGYLVVNLLCRVPTTVGRRPW